MPPARVLVVGVGGVGSGMTSMLLSLRRSAMGVDDFRPGNEDDAVLATVDWTMAVLSPMANATMNPHPRLRYVVGVGECTLAFALLLIVGVRLRKEGAVTLCA